jgi:hypothetical protein
MWPAIARERTIATRLKAARLRTALGVAILVAALVLDLMPGSPAPCGSLLAAMYPPGVGVACAAARGIWIPAAAVVGLLLVSAGAVAIPSRGSRPRR